MNYLVTGATGFIGRKLVAQIAARPGSTITYLARKRSPNLPGIAMFQSWGTGEIPSLEAVPPPDVVFHLAGEPIAQRWTPEVKQRLYSSRVDGTRSLVAALRALNKRDITLVSASATGYYGDRGNEILTETSKPGDDFLARLCVDWEREASSARAAGFRVVPVRISVVFGPNGGALPKMLEPFRMGLGAKFGSGRQWMSWIHVDDLVKLMLLAADRPELNGPLNGSSPEPVTNAEFTKTLGGIIHRPAFLSAPRALMRLALGEMAEFLFASQRVVPEATQEAGFQFAYPNLRHALAACLRADT